MHGISLGLRRDLRSRWLRPGVHGPWPLESPPNKNNFSSFIVLSLPMVVRRVLPRTIHRCARAVHHSHSLRAQIPRVIQSRDLHHFQSRDTPSAKDTNPRTKRYPLFACLIKGLSLDIRAWARWLTHKMQPASARLLFTLHGHLYWRSHGSSHGLAFLL